MKGRNVILFAVVIVVGFLLANGYTTVQIKAQANTQLFPQTGHTIKGKYLGYWTAHGGLAQQGYPITEEMQEISDSDGKPYVVQYFERAVFEWHPENQPPYDVLLSLLGGARYKEKYPAPTGAPDQKPNQSPGSVLFPQTGKKVGGSFLIYWNVNGGLAQQGYPISDEIQEKSDLDGNTYTVQYFERAVFEWHPGSTPPADVLLSQLGTFKYDTKYKAQDTHGTNPGRLLASNVYGRAASVGDDLFYLSGDAQNQAISRYNNQQGAFALITNKPGAKYPLATDGSDLVWGEPLSNSMASIVGYDLAASKEFSITRTSVSTFTLTLAVYKGILYYPDSAAGHRGLYARNLASGKEELIDEHGDNPVVSEGALLWTEFLRGSSGPPVFHLHIRKLDGSANDKILATNEGGFLTYNVSGDRIVWDAYIPYPITISVYLYTVGDKEGYPIASQGTHPLIAGNLVLWNQTLKGLCMVCGSQDDPSSIQAFDLTTRTVHAVVDYSSLGPGVAAIVGQQTLAYTIFRDAGKHIRDLYITSLDQK